MRAFDLEPTVVLLCALVVGICASLAPATALAQSEDSADAGQEAVPPPPAPPPVDHLSEDSEPSTSTGSDPLDYKPELDETYDRTPAVRPPMGSAIILETLGGIGGMLAGAFTGGLTGSLAGFAFGSPAAIETSVVIGGSTGYAVGPALGVWLTGNGLNGNGSYLATQAGSLLGALGGGLLFIGSLNSADPRPALTLAGMTTLPVLGSLLGYELSNSRPHKRDERSSQSARWSAGFAPSAGGTGGVFVFGGRW